MFTYDKQVLSTEHVSEHTGSGTVSVARTTKSGEKLFVDAGREAEGSARCDDRRQRLEGGIVCQQLSSARCLIVMHGARR